MSNQVIPDGADIHIARLAVAHAIVDQYANYFAPEYKNEAEEGVKKVANAIRSIIAILDGSEAELADQG